ncbi:MAG: protein-methionine-sulfoxide reductase catalytic subunit MsrP, partial [Gemmataceae bacterium]|nr:protein-methionine-sulfoxide reductase catalytic subunit MsrP [Gemmataceae bacterium]
MPHPSSLPERDATPPSALLTRRRLLALGIAGGIGAGAWWWLRPGSDDEVLRTRVVPPIAPDLYPAARSPGFADAERAITDRAAAARHTNFYEFSSGKAVWRHVGSFDPHPWTVEVAGLVDRPKAWDIDALVRAFPLEERVCRHRCVEAWAMVVPWVGFPLRDLLKRAGVKSGARHVRFVSWRNPSNSGPDWPYAEGLTLAEATNELAFLATGMHGAPLLKQHGAPIRLVVPWKYGFKGIKSVVRIEVTDERPATFWNTLQPH